MISIVEFCVRTRLERPLVETWVRAGWLIPPRTEPEPVFAEIDVARALLIAQLRNDLGVNDEGVTVETEAGPRHLAYGEIERARTVFEWGPAAKPGAKKKRSVS